MNAENLRQVLIPVLDKVKAEGKPIEDGSFRHCPLAWLARSIKADCYPEAEAIEVIAQKYDIPHFCLYAFAWAFDGEPMDCDHYSESFPFSELGTKFRKEYLGKNAFRS